MRNVGTALALGFAVAGADAQPFQLSVGPALRYADISPLEGRSRAWDAIAIQGSWTAALSARLRIVVGVGAVSGGSIKERVSTTSEPCLPSGSCAPPNPSVSSTSLSGDLIHARAGIGFEEGWFLAAAGFAVARSSHNVQPAGAGAFAEARVRPLRRFRRLTVGVLAYELDPAPGQQRAVITPTVGVRF